MFFHISVQETLGTNTPSVCSVTTFGEYHASGTAQSRRKTPPSKLSIKPVQEGYMWTKSYSWGRARDCSSCEPLRTIDSPAHWPRIKGALLESQKTTTNSSQHRSHSNVSPLWTIHHHQHGRRRQTRRPWPNCPWSRTLTGLCISSDHS